MSSSYLLIGFWFEKPSAADAAKKAFLTNRVGDFGFLLGILMVWAAAWLGWVCRLGQVGLRRDGDDNRLGRVPGFSAGRWESPPKRRLHVWLPDAMEGPTPVSALIHAATMVAAGVYMLCRVFFPDRRHVGNGGDRGGSAA